MRAAETDVMRAQVRKVWYASVCCARSRTGRVRNGRVVMICATDKVYVYAKRDVARSRKTETRLRSNQGKMRTPLLPYCIEIQAHKTCGRSCLDSLWLISKHTEAFFN